MRFLIAGILILTFLLLTGKLERPSKLACKNSLWLGFLFLTCGNGGVTWALQYVDSGFAALLISAQPLILLIMMWYLEKEVIPLKSYFGIALGVLGMYLLISQTEINLANSSTLGIIVIFFCLIVWGYGSLSLKKMDLPKSYLLNSGIQMLGAGCMLLCISLFLEGLALDITQVSSRAWFSLVILIFFGSIIAFTSFNYLLKHVAADKVSTSTYVNPIVALFLGYYFREEIVSQQSIFAAAILLLGVYFINSRKVSK